MRLNDRHAFLTRELPDGRLLDVQPWRLGAACLAVSAGPGPWRYLAFYWYGTPIDAVIAALLWDGRGHPRGAGVRPMLAATAYR